MKVCSYFNGGDSVTIEQYVLHSLQNAGAKLHKFFRKLVIIDKNIKFLCIYWAK